MAQKVQVLLLCDLDDGNVEAQETLPFSLGNSAYEVDVCANMLSRSARAWSPSSDMRVRRPRPLAVARAVRVRRLTGSRLSASVRGPEAVASTSTTGAVSRLRWSRSTSSPTECAGK